MGKTSFNKKVKLLLKAFDEFSKMRQVFSQKNYVDKAFEENNTVRRQSSSQATGVPEAQKVITIPSQLPSQFAQPQAQGLLTERDIDRTILTEIKLSRKLANELGEEIKEITTQVLPEEFQETSREKNKLLAGERDILSTYTEAELDAIMTGKPVPIRNLSDAGREYLNLVLGNDDDSEPSIVIENKKNVRPPLGDGKNSNNDEEYEDDSLDFEDDSLDISV